MRVLIGGSLRTKSFSVFRSFRKRQFGSELAEEKVVRQLMAFTHCS